MVDRSHATSTTPAVVPVVARNRDDSEPPEKAAIDVDDRDPPQLPGAGVNKRRRGNAQVEPPPRKRGYSKPCFHYREREDGQPPEMSLLHVNFAQLCVDLLKKKPDLTQGSLMSNFNASEYSRIELYPVIGQKSSGKADHFFCNGYFRIQKFKDIAMGLLLLPVPFKRDLAHQAATG
jgi:hypothetical protein